MADSSVRSRPPVTFAVLALGIGAFALLQSLVIPVLTTVQHQLHTTQNTVTWVLTAYLLSASIMTPILGRVGDMIGKRRIFVATLIALSAGSLLAAVAPSIGVMIAARVIQGFAGGMLPVAFGIIRDEFPAKSMFIVGIFAGRLARKLGGKALVIAGCLTGCGAMSILAFAHQYEWQIYLSNALMGIGFGLAFSAMSALIVAAVPPSQTGVASGMNANIRTIGGSIGSAVMASIVTSQLAPTGLPEEAGYTTGFAVMAGGLLLAALAGLLMPSARRLRQAAVPEHAERAMVAAGTVVGDESE